MVTLPYIRHLSETIQRILAPLRIRTCFRPRRTLRQTLVRLKDQTLLQQQAGVIYRIPCGTCSKVYIGQTGRTLEHRLKEHRRALASENTAQSAVAEHAVEQMHVINWNEAEVVACHPYYRQRCALEAWHIRTEAQTMNHDVDLGSALTVWHVQKWSYALYIQWTLAYLHFSYPEGLSGTALIYILSVS